MMWVNHASDILREFLSHNFVSGLRTLKPKKPKNFFLKKLLFFQPWLQSLDHYKIGKRAS